MFHISINPGLSVIQKVDKLACKSLKLILTKFSLVSSRRGNKSYLNVEKVVAWEIEVSASLQINFTHRVQIHLK